MKLSKDDYSAMYYNAMYNPGKGFRYVELLSDSSSSPDWIAPDHIELQCAARSIEEDPIWMYPIQEEMM